MLSSFGKNIDCFTYSKYCLRNNKEYKYPVIPYSKSNSNDLFFPKFFNSISLLKYSLK